MAITVLKYENMTVHSSEDVIRVRQFVRVWALELGFGLVNQTKFVTATSELARNMLEFGGGGMVRQPRCGSSDRERWIIVSPSFIAAALLTHSVHGNEMLTR